MSDHSAHDLGSRSAVVAHLHERHGWHGTLPYTLAYENQTSSVLDEALLRAPDGRWYIFTEQYLAIHRELHETPA